MIEQRLLELDRASSLELIQSIGITYRAHYRCRCKGMSWTLPLPVLQLASVCLGPSVLVGVFRALAMNFKFFSSGAPDLLLLRLRSSTSPSTTMLLSEVLGDPHWRGSAHSLDAVSSEEELSQPVKRHRRFVPSSPIFSEELKAEIEESVDSSPVKADAFICAYSEDIHLPSHCTSESMLVEVKGPSDHLSRQQISWLKVLRSHGAKAFVCRVREDKLMMNHESRPRQRSKEG